MNNRSPGKVFCLIILFCLYLSSALYAQTTSPGQASTGYGSTENYITSTFASYELGNFNNGTQLFYYIPDVLKNGTSAPAVIFLHGMFATTPPFQEGNGYSKHLTHLLRQGYIVIYPQFNTDYDLDQNVMLDRCVASTNVALAAIGSQVETDNLVLYGHSVGGIFCVCWEGTGGVPVKALVTAQGNMNPCAGGMPAFVCPLITKLDYQTLAPSMTCSAILLWGDADISFATWSQQLDAFNSLTNVSSKVIYTSQSDDYGDPDLTADHGAPNPPVDTLDYRYYWAALDAALDDQTVVTFDMGLWSDGNSVKPVLEDLAPDPDCPSGADNDADRVCAYVDNCPDLSNSEQEDTDNDAMGDVCDNCPNDMDNDIDDDSVCGDVDNCPDMANPIQQDADNDGTGDACDADTIYGTITGAVPGIKVDLVKITCGSEVLYERVRTNAEGYFSFGSVPQGFYTVVPRSLYDSFDPLNGIVLIPQTEIQLYNFTATIINNLR